MEYVNPVAQSWIIVYAPLLLVTIVFGAALYCLFARRWLLFGIVMVTALVISGVSTIVSLNNQNEVSETSQLRIDSINETYGIAITPEDFYKLNYPSITPTSDLEVFGSFKVDSIESNEQDFVTLVWIDGELKLCETSSAEAIGEELPRVNSLT